MYKNIIEYGRSLFSQSAPDAKVFLSDVYKRSARAKKLQADDVQDGKSMIEMLGVLAIVGVLSVGGIAGYSKAMEKYKLNKAIKEYGYLIQGLLEHRENIIKNAQTESIINFATAVNITPATWKLKGNYLEDDFGNLVSLYNTNTMDLDNDMKRLGIIIYLNGQSVKNTIPGKFCIEMFNNLIIPLKSFIQRGYVYKSGHNLSDILYLGDKYCSNTYKCLKDITLNDINTTCRDCDKTNESCQIIISF